MIGVGLDRMSPDTNRECQRMNRLPLGGPQM